MRVGLLGLALVALLGATLVRPAAAWATIGPCCGDGLSVVTNGDIGDVVYGPTIYVSDGTVVTASVDVWDTPQNTTGISYTVHIPVGTSISSYAFQGPLLVGQSLNVIADEAPYQYEVDAVVGDAGDVEVDGTTSAANDNISLYEGATVSGTANSDVVTTPSSG